jgi:hypothetical protein
MIKLLKDERIEREDGEVSFTLKVITNSQQARLMDLGSRTGSSSRVELTKWCLASVVDKIRIDGVDFKADELAEQADLSDTDTYLVYLKIGKMVIDAVFSHEDDKKK